MNDNLFDLPESKSPRLQWMDKHGIWTEERPDVEECNRWKASAAGMHGFGIFEIDALTELAGKMKIKLWNQS